LSDIPQQFTFPHSSFQYYFQHSAFDTPTFNTPISIMFDIYALAVSLVGGAMITLLANVASIKSRSLPKTLRDTLSSLIVRIRHFWSPVMDELTIDD
jgi:hypothetical protein